MSKPIIKSVYECIIILLAIISILLVVLDAFNVINIDKTPFSSIDELIYLIFFCDYFGGLILSKKKLNYIKDHIFDLIAIIPVNLIQLIPTFSNAFGVNIVKGAKLARITRITRLVKMFRIMRAAGTLGKFKDKIKTFLETNNFIYFIGTCSLIAFFSTILYAIAEKMSLWKAFYWALVMLTTVGNGNPKTTFGKIISVILMLVGLGVAGILTSTISSFFLNPKTKKAEEHKDEADTLSKYYDLYKKDAITKDEYLTKKREILGKSE